MTVKAMEDRAAVFVGHLILWSVLLGATGLCLAFVAWAWALFAAAVQ